MYNRLKNNKNLIKAIFIGYLAAFLFVLFSFGVNSVPVEPEAAPEPETAALVTAEHHRRYSRPVSSLKEITHDVEEEKEEEFVPAPDKLNLAYFFPDDADISDSINSYAGQIYTVMNTLNADFFASYFDLTDTTPLAMANSRGLGADRVMGQYNPEDRAHDQNNPGTWTVNRFKNVNVSFYNGDGSRINGYYNAQEIMALASVYAYYHDMEDAEAMEAYCRALFEKAVGAKVSLGNVYYCSGCLNRTVEQESNEAIAMENQQSELENSLGSHSSGYIAVDMHGNVVSPITEAGQSAHQQTEQVVVSPSLASEIATASGNVIIQTSSYEETYTHDYAVANRDLTATKASETDTVTSGEDVVVSGTSAETAAQTDNTQPSATEQTAASAAQSEAPVIQDTTGAVTESTSKSNSIDDQIVVSPAKVPLTQPATETQAPAEDAAISGEPAVIGLLPGETPIFLNGAITNIDENIVVSPSKSTETAAAVETEDQAVVSTPAADTNTQDPSLSDLPAETVQTAVSETHQTEAQTVVSETAQHTSAQTEETAQSYVVSNAEGATAASVGVIKPSSAGESQMNAETGTDPASPSNEQTVTKAYCPGHIDLYVSITIRGIDDKNGLFKIDPIGNNEENFNENWQGWTEDKIALAKALCEQDWFDNSGLSISSIRVNSPLTEEEIKKYIDSLPASVSMMRKKIVEFALNSVGKVPYYWGGKPSGPGYENNTFHLLITPDYRGRILKGLDCSGWINWVYWSVTGRSLAGQSTGSLIGCGKKISRSDLQPGDIIIRTGADAHVVMFLCWAQNGNFIGIHETGGVTNNVAVKEMTASWPYYRSLLD